MDDLLTKWLEGASLAELDADERALRQAIAELQAYVSEAHGQRNALSEDARKVNLLLGTLAEQYEAEGNRFGDHEPDSFWHGYVCGRGAMARQAQRALEFLGNVIRTRAYYSSGGGDGPPESPVEDYLPDGPTSTAADIHVRRSPL